LKFCGLFSRKLTVVYRSKSRLSSVGNGQNLRQHTKTDKNQSLKPFPDSECFPIIIWRDWRLPLQLGLIRRFHLLLTLWNELTNWDLNMNQNRSQAS